MTLNGVISPILHFLPTPNSIPLLADYVTVVEDRPMMSLNIVSRFQSSTFGHNEPTLQRGLSAIAELLVIHAKCQAVCPAVINCGIGADTGYLTVDLYRRLRHKLAGRLPLSFRHRITLLYSRYA